MSKAAIAAKAATKIAPNSEAGKIILYIGGAVIGAIVLRMIAKILEPIIDSAGGLADIFKGLGEAAGGVYGGISDTVSGTNADKKDGEGLTTTTRGTKGKTITTTQAARIANEQENAMAGIGTNEDALVNQLKGLTGDDLKAVYKAFGKRRYNWFGGSQKRGAYLTLFGWYGKEVSGRTRMKLRVIWKKTGINMNSI